ncbi:MAG: double zinc ribbon domain-containing protein [Gemmatimonadales bacterium]
MLELAGIVGLALVLVGMLMLPLLRKGPDPDDFDEPLPLEETREGQALLALKDLDFDHATGKISEDDYAAMKGQFTSDALAALRSEQVDPVEQLVAARRAVLEGVPAGLSCPTCGPRSEPDARYCSDCGVSLQSPTPCAACAAPLPADARFCAACGARALAT